MLPSGHPASIHSIANTEETVDDHTSTNNSNCHIHGAHAIQTSNYVQMETSNPGEQTHVDGWNGGASNGDENVHGADYNGDNILESGQLECREQPQLMPLQPAHLHGTGYTPQPFPPQWPQLPQVLPDYHRFPGPPIHPAHFDQFRTQLAQVPPPFLCFPGPQMPMATVRPGAGFYQHGNAVTFPRLPSPQSVSRPKFRPSLTPNLQGFPRYDGCQTRSEHAGLKEAEIHREERHRLPHDGRQHDGRRQGPLHRPRQRLASACPYVGRRRYSQRSDSIGDGAVAQHPYLRHHGRRQRPQDVTPDAAVSGHHHSSDHQSSRHHSSLRRHSSDHHSSLRHHFSDHQYSDHYSTRYQSSSHQPLRRHSSDHYTSHREPRHLWQNSHGSYASMDCSYQDYSIPGYSHPNTTLFADPGQKSRRRSSSKKLSSDRTKSNDTTSSESIQNHCGNIDSKGQNDKPNDSSSTNKPAKPVSGFKNKFRMMTFTPVPSVPAEATSAAAPDPPPPAAPRNVPAKKSSYRVILTRSPTHHSQATSAASTAKTLSSDKTEDTSANVDMTSSSPPQGDFSNESPSAKSVSTQETNGAASVATSVSSSNTEPVTGLHEDAVFSSSTPRVGSSTQSTDSALTHPIAQGVHAVNDASLTRSLPSPVVREDADLTHSTSSPPVLTPGTSTPSYGSSSGGLSDFPCSDVDLDDPSLDSVFVDDVGPTCEGRAVTITEFSSSVLPADTRIQLPASGIQAMVPKNASSRTDSGVHMSESESGAESAESELAVESCPQEAPADTLIGTLVKRFCRSWF